MDEIAHAYSYDDKVMSSIKLTHLYIYTYVAQWEIVRNLIIWGHNCKYKMCVGVIK